MWGLRSIWTSSKSLPAHHADDEGGGVVPSVVAWRRVWERWA